MPQLLSAPVAPVNAADLAQVLTSAWYARIEATGSDTGAEIHDNSAHKELGSCRDYLDFANMIAPRTVQAARESESNALLELMVMCRATMYLRAASPATTSYLPEVIYTANSPQYFPAELALQSSAAEAALTVQNRATRYWADVNSGLTQVEVSEFVSSYRGGGIRQTLSVVGYGDVDRDGCEDVVMVSHDQLEGSRYYNLRLFVMTVDATHTWRVLAQFSL